MESAYEILKQQLPQFFREQSSGGARGFLKGLGDVVGIDSPADPYGSVMRPETEEDYVRSVTSGLGRAAMVAPMVGPAFKAMTKYPRASGVALGAATQDPTNAVLSLPGLLASYSPEAEASKFISPEAVDQILRRIAPRAAPLAVSGAPAKLGGLRAAFGKIGSLPRAPSMSILQAAAKAGMSPAQAESLVRYSGEPVSPRVLAQHIIAPQRSIEAGKSRVGIETYPEAPEYLPQEVLDELQFGGYEPMQRQPESEMGQYFESVLRGPEDMLPLFDEQMHFFNPNYLGHVRGAVLPEGRVMLDELQSDVVSDNLGRGELENIYGQIGKGLLGKLVDTEATMLSVPSAERVLTARPQVTGNSQKFFRDTYGPRMQKQLFRPLAEAGVPISEADGFTDIMLSPEIRALIKANPEILNYAKGGAVSTKRGKCGKLCATCNKYPACDKGE